MKKTKSYKVDKKGMAFLIAAVVIAAVIAVFASGFKAWTPLITVLILYVAGFLMLLNRGRRLQWKVSAGGSSEKNQPFGFKVTASNKGYLPIAFLGLDFDMINLANGESIAVSENISMGPKSDRTFDLDLKSQYSGVIRLSLDRAYISGILGIVKRQIPVDMEMDYTVFPSVTEMNLNQETIAGYDMESFKYSDSKKGTDPGEIFGIREYQSGDSVKTIHWKLSGKLGHIMVREMGFPVENNIMILLDRKPMDNSPENVDRITDLFFSLSLAIAEQGIKHDIGWYDSSRMKFIVRTVENTAAVWERGAEALSAPSGGKMSSTINEFIQSDIDKIYSNYLIVGDQPEDIERLMEYGEVTEFSTKTEN